MLIPMNYVINAQYRTSVAPVDPEKLLSSSQSPNMFVYWITPWAPLIILTGVLITVMRI